jgi:hypothetical protein
MMRPLGTLNPANKSLDKEIAFPPRWLMSELLYLSPIGIKPFMNDYFVTISGIDSITGLLLT